MLRSIDPIISASLLAAVHSVKAGGWIAITSRTLPAGRPSVDSSITVEQLAPALFPVLPVSSVTDTPLLAWLAEPGAEESLDAFFTVQGSARDAERRTIEMAELSDLPSHAWDNVDTVITVESDVDFAFFVCVGGESHDVAALLTDRIRIAA
ncbi:hypothetical protein ACFVWR_14125 [Leifsonia sp. NPDC058292]|uniref:hypothetical protein n=1 Tax=Leifsonia sp. NPDC058292 TaxID=3346428 RepID=UPI0036D8F343